MKPVPPWLERNNLHAAFRPIRFALFDFDGTISVIRRGWEAVMNPLMLEMIAPPKSAADAIEAEVAAYINESTGIRCIQQMQWLAETVQRYGYNPAPQGAKTYKRIYNERLLVRVQERIANLDGNPDALMLAGVRIFLQGLVERGVELYLVSGTDHEYVLAETEILNVQQYFHPHIYGSLDDDETQTKSHIIARIMQQNQLEGSEFLVVGDGPVEIRHGQAAGAQTLGVAIDESERFGLDAHKRQRLLRAQADWILTDFRESPALLARLFGAA